MISFRVEVQDVKVHEGARECLKAFKHLIKAIDTYPNTVLSLPNKFTFTSEDKWGVIRDIRDSLYVAPVRTYRPWNGRFSKAIGRFYRGRIEINEFALARMDVADVAGNIAHESMHALGYKHKGNKITPENLKSVPYVIGYWVEQWLREQK
jgi:hypothetical protein